MTATATLFRNVKRGRDPELARVLPPTNRRLGDAIYGEHSWDGGKTWYRFSAALSLLRIRLAVDESAEAAERIWPMSDYGTMGYDWSAIRDSEPETVAEMERVAMRYVPDGVLFRRLGLAA